MLVYTVVMVKCYSVIVNSVALLWFTQGNLTFGDFIQSDQNLAPNWWRIKWIQAMMGELEEIAKKLMTVKS